MARTVSIGAQRFAELREGGFFYVDKTGFIRDWWGEGDTVTLMCRPRRFGKTLGLSTAECFLSTRFAGRGEELFGELEVWGDPAMRELQGTVPVIALSFAKVKEAALEPAKASMKRIMREAIRAHDYLTSSETLNDDERTFLARVSDDMDDGVATDCLGQLCSMLERHHGVKPVVLLDEYDTPMQEAWLHGYWDGMRDFVRSLFNATFKTNPALGRALITGITRIASESIFSDMNNPRVVTTTTPAYEDAFGFTQSEVEAALDEFGLADQAEVVRSWYDGFTFGDVPDIYNPWSITCYLKDRRVGAYWVNTSSNGLVSSLVRRGDARLKEDFETLLSGGTVTKVVEEPMTFARLGGDADSDAVWSLLLATGYVRVESRATDPEDFSLELALTNREVRIGFDGMVRDWFRPESRAYNGFVEALLAGDTWAMNSYLSDVALACMSSFDSAVRPSEAVRPERFWHGLVLGLLVELRGRYAVESNRESGFGRCDVMLVPNDGPDGTDPAVILEFKVMTPTRDGERELADTVASALAQIEARAYASALAERGIAPERIHAYGIAFRGKEVLVG